jgi:hypothetical protein
MHYIIYWWHTLNGNNDSSNVSSEDNSFVTEVLDTCVEYEVSIRAVNEKDKSTNAVTGKTTTETAVNCPVQIIFFYIYDVGMDKLKLMVMSSLLAGCLICRIPFSCFIDHIFGFHG